MSLLRQLILRNSISVKIRHILLSPIQWIASIPPVDQRPRLSGKIKYVIYTDYDQSNDETFIYYKAFIITFIINVVFLVFFLVSYMCSHDANIRIFTIRYNPSAPVDTLVYDYPRYAFPIFALVILFYTSAMLAIKTDYFSRERVNVENTIKSRFIKSDFYTKKPFAFIPVILFFVATGYNLWAWPEFVTAHHPGSSG